MGFFKSFIKELIDAGNIVDIATNNMEYEVPICYKDWGCKIYRLSCSRSVLAKGNIAAIKQIKKIVSNGEYDIVHCHTPIASICTRIACQKLRKNGLKVIYTAHGFHFYKGAPIMNWILYYPIEKFCSRFTDVLITINREDFSLAKLKMKASSIKYIPGVGIDLNKLTKSVRNRHSIHNELNISDDKIILLSVGELNTNKNHETVIRAIAALNDTQRDKLVYLITGKGPLKQHLLEVVAELNLNDCVKLLGFRDDVATLYNESQIFVFPSKREGLPVSLMEAMAFGNFCIVSNIRGNTDLIEEGSGGHIILSNQVKEWSDYLAKILVNNNTYSDASINIERVNNFSTSLVNAQLLEIYTNL